MRALRRVITAPGRRTRFHTAHGELMPAHAWLQLPSNVAARVSGHTGGVPWIVPSAVSHLRRTLPEHARVFEFGSGHSTAWYAARCAHVVSVEHDQIWLDDVEQSVRRARLTNCELRHAEVDTFPAVIGGYPDETFDLVVVDGCDTARTDRLDCVAAAAAKVRRGGQLLLDDSDNPRYRAADELLSGWVVRRFVGTKPVPLVATETSLYRRAQ